METQTWLSCHYKFISAENITILSVSSEDFLHVEEQQMWNYSSCEYIKKFLKIIYIYIYIYSLSLSLYIYIYIKSIYLYI